MEQIIEYITKNYIDIIGASIGILYLYLEYKASIWMWLASIVMACFFIYIFYTSQLFASMIIYAYFLGASIYGWISWATKNRKEETGEHIISKVPSNYYFIILGLASFCFIIISALLYYTTENRVLIVLGDALATALNIVALWMATRKWAEQWCLLIPANFISGGLLLLQGQIASSCMFFIFFIVSILGYFNWKKMAEA